MYGSEVLGKKAREKVTGLEGIVTGRCEYLYGCVQLLILPPAQANKVSEGQWYDEGRIEILGDGLDPEDVQGDDPGGPSMGPDNH